MHLSRHVLATALSLASGLAPGLAHADQVVTPAITYTFSAAPAGWQPFSFSFEVPALLQAGDAYSFAPFSISDGSSQWEISQGSSTTYLPQGRCFLFGSAGVSLVNGADTQCSLGTPTGQAGFWFFDGQTSLPTAPGQYDNWYVAVFADGSPASGGQDFNGQLTISAVPEPTGAWLLMAGLGVVALRSRRQQA